MLPTEHAREISDATSQNSQICPAKTALGFDLHCRKKFTGVSGVRTGKATSWPEWGWAHLLQNRAGDVQHTRRKKPAKSHFITKFCEAVRDQGMRHWNDPTEAQGDEHFRARTSMGRFAIFWVEDDVRCA